MKKTLRFLISFIVILAIASPVIAQKKDKKYSGTITYTIKSVGSKEVPLGMEEMTFKVMGTKMINADQTILVNDRTLFQILDFSQIQMYVQSQGIPFDYEGPWKGYLKTTISDADIDSLMLNDSYKIEYLTDTKEILGMTAKKAIITTKNEEGEVVETTEIWYTNEIGPDYDFMINYGLKGFALEFNKKYNEEIEISYVVKELKKGKVKDTEFLLPAGFDEITKEQYANFIEKFEELKESLQE